MQEAVAAEHAVDHIDNVLPYVAAEADDVVVDEVVYYDTHTDSVYGTQRHWHQHLHKQLLQSPDRGEPVGVAQYEAE